MLSGQLALASAAFFAGAAVYVSLVEHPARRDLDDGSALIEWKPAYRRGAAIQAPLAIVAFVFGLLAWRQTGEHLWLVGAAIMIANWPYTLAVIRPVNDRLKQTAPAEAGLAGRALLEKWARLHAVRTGLGCGATVVFLLASLR